MPRALCRQRPAQCEASTRPRGRDTEVFVRPPLSRPNTLRVTDSTSFFIPQFSCPNLPAEMIVRKTGRSVHAKN